VRDLLGTGSIDDAYAVQRINADRMLAEGHRVVGWKIGLTSVAVQSQLGVDQPDFGVLFAAMCAGDDEPIELNELLQPRVEAEVAFVLGADVETDQITTVDVLRATDFVTPAIEVVDSRIAEWDITIVDTIADNASSGRFVVGARPTPLRDVDLRGVQMTLSADGEVVSKGSGAACLSHPVNAVVWLANTLVARGQALRAGDVVLSGALGPMHPVTPGTRYEAILDGLGSVRATFS
jgi:2-keto-4-pentenoate hydratase